MEDEYLMVAGKNNEKVYEEKEVRIVLSLFNIILILLKKFAEFFIIFFISFIVMDYGFEKYGDKFVSFYIVLVIFSFTWFVIRGILCNFENLKLFIKKNVFYKLKKK